jgi:Na+-transporting methylmalonyl-CoA/oxaloacetate decarboxylase gamma subunit
MGIAASQLTAVANFTVLNTIFIMVGTMIIGRNKDWKGWILLPYAVLLYQVIVTLGANVRNPLSLYAGQDEVDANIIFNIIFPIWAFLYSIMGWAWTRVLDSADLFPLGVRFDYLVYPSTRTVITVDENEKVTIEQDCTRPAKQPTTQPPPSWSHLLITLFYFLIIAAGQVVYDYFIAISGDEWIAWVVNLGVGIVFSLLYLIYCVVWTDIYVFGYSKRELKKLEIDSETRTNIATETRQRVIWTIVPIMAFHFIGNFTLGVTRILSTDVDVNWLVALGYFAFLLVLLIIVFIVIRRKKSSKSKSKTPKVNDGGDYYQKTASVIPTNSVRQDANTTLGSYFMDM